MFLQWEIWRVEWPYDDGTVHERYALLFSSNRHNQTGEAPYFMKISTKDRPEANSKIFVALNDSRFKGCNLPRDSYFYPGKVRRLIHPATLWVVGFIPEEGQKIITLEIMRVTGIP